MKVDKFINLLRTVIREEVQLAVRKELQSLTEGKLSNVTLESQAPAVKRSTVQTKVRAPKQYVSNPILNEILNETESHSLNESVIEYNDFSEWPDMNSAALSRSNINNATMLTDINGNKVSAAALANTEAGAAVITAIQKDYSSLMKAIDAKKGK